MSESNINNISSDSNYSSDLSSLIALGFDPAISAQALAVNNSLEDAINFILEKQANNQSNSSTINDTSNFTAMDFSLKMVLVVRTDLGMSPGKIAAQCVHAALGAYRYVANTDQQLLNIWEMTGEKAVCLRIKSQEELLQLEKEALAHGLPHYLVCDAGRTQIDPGSHTVLAIGPSTEDKINAITGKLKLY